MKKHHKTAKEDEKKIEKEMAGIMETSPELASNYRILVSFKGIAPYGKQSGTSIYSIPRHQSICKQTIRKRIA